MQSKEAETYRDGPARGVVIAEDPGRRPGMNEAEHQALAEAVAERLEIAAAPRPLLTLAEVAEVLRCSDKSIRRMVKDGRLTAFKTPNVSSFDPRKSRTWYGGRE